MTNTSPAATETAPNTPAQDAAPPNPAPAVQRPPYGRGFLFVAAVLFVGWLCWLGYTAMTRSQSPYISRAQAAGATTPIVAELTDGADGRGLLMIRHRQIGPEVIELKEKADKPAVVVKVVESWKGGPEKGASIGVINLTNCTGYTGPGTYLLLLNAELDATVEKVPAFSLAGAQRSPGADFSEAGTLRIYAWNEKTNLDLRKQVEKLFP